MGTRVPEITTSDGESYRMRTDAPAESGAVDGTIAWHAEAMIASAPMPNIRRHSGETRTVLVVVDACCRELLMSDDERSFPGLACSC